MKRKFTPKSSVETLLLDAGLSEKEGRVYQTLLEKGTLSAPEIVKAAGIKKGITYTILHKLASEELILEFQRDKKLYYQPSDPAKLKEFIQRRKRSIEDVSLRIDRMLPDLKSSYKLSVGKPTIQYFEGKEGIKRVFEDIYAPKKEPVYGAVDIDNVDEFFSGLPEDILIPKRLKSKLEVNVIFNDTPHAQRLHSLDSKQYRTSLLWDRKKYPLPADIEAYEDKVALLSFKKNDFIGMIVQNEDFAITLRSLLRYIFDHADYSPGREPSTSQPQEK